MHITHISLAPDMTWYINQIEIIDLHVLENQQSAYAKTKTQISFAVTGKLISAFVFATWVVQSFFFLNPKFQASSLFL